MESFPLHTYTHAGVHYLNDNEVHRYVITFVFLFFIYFLS